MTLGGGTVYYERGTRVPNTLATTRKMLTSILQKGGWGLGRGGSIEMCVRRDFFFRCETVLVF